MKLKWYLCPDPEGPTDLWLCDNPPLSVYYEAPRGWCWIRWTDTTGPTEVLDGGEGFDTATKAKAAAETALQEA